jgi:FdhD protein
MPRGRTATHLVHRVDGGGVRRQPDELVVEEPLEIRLDDHLVATTMRTPGNDFELAAGLCFTDGLLAGAPVLRCRYCSDEESASEREFNVVSVETGHRAPVPVPRLTTTTSSCGLCGSTSIEDLRERLRPLPALAPIELDVLLGVPERLEAEQGLFASTGAVHGAAAFDRSGRPVAVREDIGRHNAVDKVIGWALENDRIPLVTAVLLVSGRASFELTQKAVMAGIPLLAAVSAPSSLAVDLASQSGLTLVAFLRGDSMNVYTRPDRIVRS